MPYRITTKGREMLAASAMPSDFPSNQLVVPKPVLFKSDDGFEIHGQLFVPSGRSAPGPALIFMHGGPVRQMMLGFHYMDYYHNAYAMNQFLASQGYVVLSVNYRLGIMYGRAFRVPQNASWRGASEYKDIVAAGKYLRTLPIVDAKKIGLWGGSYGGFLTAMGLARNSDMFAAGVDLHGVHDWSVFLPHWENRPGAPDVAEANKLAFESSPDSAVAQWKSPVLLIHGDDDRNVPFGQSVELAQRLRDNHVPMEQLVFPDEIHGFLMFKSWMRAYTATAEFFDRTLKRGEAIGK
jgi:dipeptidyl aminopeptidase/acylaminoacyl peptidase